MSKYSCEVIQDLLALYHDGVCSEGSRKAVEQHLSECEMCSAVAKQLEDTELENNISEQSGSVLKKHGKRQRRIIAAIISGAFIVLAAVVFFWVIKPRMEFNKLLNDYLPEVGEGAEYFTAYDIMDDSLVPLETKNFTIDIPVGYVQKDTGDIDAVMYFDSENTERSVFIRESGYDMSGMNMFDRLQYGDMSEEEFSQIVYYLKEWMEALGHGISDSAYGTYKCAYLLSDNDRSFWNIGQNIAFGIMGFIKQSLPVWGEEMYIYEADDKCGFVFVSAPKEENENYRITAEIYSTDDLNVPYNVIIRSETLEEAYSIINSITFE